MSNRIFEIIGQHGPSNEPQYAMFHNGGITHIIATYGVSVLH